MAWNVRSDPSSSDRAIDRHHLARGQVGHAGDRERLAPGEAQRRGALARQELERQHAHAHEVGAVDPLVALGDDGADAQERGALGRPVARGAGAVLLAGEEHQRHALVAVAHRRVVDEGLLAVGQVERVRPLLALDEPVAQPDVAEGAAHHHLVVAAPGPVRVEVERRDAVGLQPLAGGRPGGDGAGGADVVRGDRVAEDREHAGAHDVGERRGLRRQAREERRVGDVGGRRVPLVAVAGGDGDRAPLLVALEHRGVGLAEQLRVDGRGDDVPHLVRRRPDVGEHDGGAVRRRAQRLRGEVDVHAPGQRVGDDQRRRGEVRGPHERVDAALEVAVARQDGRDDQLVGLDGLGDRLVERPAVADAGGAAVAGEGEPEVREGRHQPGPLEVAGDRPRPGGQRGLGDRRAPQAPGDRVPREEPGADHHRRVGGVGAGGDGRDRHRPVADLGGLAAGLDGLRPARPTVCG